MQIAGLKMTDLWADRILRQRGIQTAQAKDQACELGVFIDQIYFEHHGPEDGYRPYLHLSGELRSVTPEGVTSWPYGVESVVFSPGSGDPVDAFYEFDAEQLNELVRKGYFQPGFEVPTGVTGIQWELPARADALVMAPVDERDVPVVFVQVHEIAALNLDLASTGYDLVEYFRDQSTERPKTTQAEVMGTPARNDEYDNLFADDEPLEVFDSQEATRLASRQDEAEEPSDLDRQLQAMERQLADEREAVRRDRENTAGTTENLYRDKVSSLLPAHNPRHGRDEAEEATQPVLPTAAAVRLTEDARASVLRKIERDAADIAGHDWPEDLEF